MFPKGLPDDHVARIVELNHSVTWRDQTASNTFHFLLDRPTEGIDADMLYDGFSDWFTREMYPLPAPADYLPFNISLGELIVESAIAYSQLPVISGHYRKLLMLDRTDPVVIGRGTAIMVRWVTGYSGRGTRGRTFLGPVGQRLLSSEGTGLMTFAGRQLLSLAWNTLVDACRHWYVFDAHWRLILLHSKPRFPSDDPQGWYDYINYGYIPDRTFRAMSRRVPPPYPGVEAPFY